MAQEEAPQVKGIKMTFLTRKRLAHKVMNAERFEAELAIVAMKTGKTLNEARKEAYLMLRELVCVQTPLFGSLQDRVLGSLYTRPWSLDVDWDALKHLQKEYANKSLVFLPTHPSYADSFILSKVLQSLGMPRNYVLSGDNLKFFPLGTIGSHSGVVFIRRSFKNDDIYKLVVREYMRYLLASGANLEWYMEGGRSRTGKLRPPKYGLLRYLVDAIYSDAVEDIMLVPVSTTYDQLQEVGKMMDEETGIAKEKEGFLWLTRYIRAQKRGGGKAYVRFGPPFSLRNAIQCENKQPQWTLDKIAFEVFQRINHVTPVTAPALITIALLSVHDHALTLQEVHEVIEPLLKYASQRNLPTTALDCLNSLQGIEEQLNILIESGVAGRYDSGLVPVFYIVPGKHSVAAFYRNSTIHWFVNRAVVEIGIMAASQEETCDPISQGLDKAFALRDLLKFEFIFSEKSVFSEEIKEEARLIDPNLQKLVPGQAVSKTVLKKAPFLIAHRVLPAFLEAYFIVANQLAMHPSKTPVDEHNFLQQCIAVGRQYILQKRLLNPECVSLELFKNALSLAANRNLLQSGTEDLANKRHQFAKETWTAVAAVAAIGDLDYRRHHLAED